MKSYHEVWLDSHPHRSHEWLADKLRDGFDVHHLDGNHANDDPDNLVLIEAADHMMLHGGRLMRRLGGPGRKTDGATREAARYWRARGCSFNEIARLVGCSRSTVIRHTK